MKIYESFYRKIEDFNSVAVQGVLFDFDLKQLFSKRLVFPPLYHDFYRLLLATFKDYWVPRIIFVL